MKTDLSRSLKAFVFKPQFTWPYPRILLDTIVSGLSLCIVVITGLRFFGVSDESLFGENAVLETLQIAALATATILAVLAAVRLRPAGRFVAITTALMCLMFLVREIPSCQTDIDIGCVPRDAHRLVPATCILLLFMQTFMMYRTSAKALVHMLHPAFSWPLAFVAVLLLSGEIFENLDFNAPEEIVELVAYTGLCLSGLWMLASSFQDGVWQTFSHTSGALLQRLNTSCHRRR